MKEAESQSAVAVAVEEISVVPHGEETVAAETLIEEISIDGMCGVY